MPADSVGNMLLNTPSLYQEDFWLSFDDMKSYLQLVLNNFSIPVQGFGYLTSGDATVGFQDPIIYPFPPAMTTGTRVDFIISGTPQTQYPATPWS